MIMMIDDDDDDGIKACEALVCKRHPECFTRIIS